MRRDEVVRFVSMYEAANRPWWLELLGFISPRRAGEVLARRIEARLQRTVEYEKTRQRITAEERRRNFRGK